jgi:PAS domain S-box-containing protein
MPAGTLPASDACLRDMIAALPAAIYTTDAAGRITFYNEAAAALWGRRPKIGEDQWCGSWKLYRPDGTRLAHDECPLALTLKTGRPVRGMEAVAERLDGSRVPFLPHPTPIFTTGGELIGAINMLVDLSERKRSEDNARLLASIVQSSDDAIISKDLSGIISSWNDGAERIFGYTAAEAIGRPITMIIPADRADEEQKILARLRRGERIDHFETVRRHKDGRLLDISITVSPIYGSSGWVVGASKIARDITERKRAEERQRILLGEIVHRVKNTLATVQAIATSTLRRAPADERDQFTARLHALSKAHDLLTGNAWDQAPMRGVVNAGLGSFPQRRFELGGPDVALATSTSLHLALALHELATNAVKHGALSNPEGRVRLSWEIIEQATTQIAGQTQGQQQEDAEGHAQVVCGRQGGDLLKVRWEESGGRSPARVRRRGFGTLLIEHAFERASFAYAPSGLVCTFELPLAAGRH